MNASTVICVIKKYLMEELGLCSYDPKSDDSMDGLHRIYLPGKKSDVPILKVITILNYLGQVYDFKYNISRNESDSGWNIAFYIPIDLDDLKHTFEVKAYVTKRIVR